MYFFTYRGERLRKETIDTALAFCDTYLGQGLYDTGMLEKIRSSPRHYFYVIFDKDEAIGIFHCYAASGLQSAQELTDEALEVCAENDTVGIFRGLVLKEAYRKTGLADEILSCCFEMLREKEKVRVIFALAWVNSDHIPAKNILTKCGLSMHKRIHQPWKSNENLHCFACGKEHCECDGILYYKSFSD